MTQEHDILQRIFDTALDLSGSERDIYLARACGDDTPLRACVEKLLRASDRAGAFLAHPEQGAAGVPGTADFHTVTLPVSEKPGDRIGRYKLLQQIGEGGCGVVYMAEQEEPVRRRVALKVIKQGMDTKQVIARFEAERQALAMMDHPNIARVFDGGATENGRPYFVLELVRGIKITDYCDRNNLSTTDRLKLFVQVCHAIRHAHQKGIIHRDIKPSNILIMLADDVPTPKVIDFGIAKAIGERLTEKTVFTRFEQFIGTPAYTSPEQAGMSGLDVDTRSDIYALGVLLYELLTGRTPFEDPSLAQSGLNEMLRRIREEEPPKPSTRLSRLEQKEQTTTAQRRQTEAPKLIRSLRGDLDWIVMKCLEKDRTRRYETANELAMDIERHLTHEPVVARPPSTVYRTQKFMRRNKLMVTAAGLVTAALVLGIAVSTGLARRASCLRVRAEANEQKAIQARDGQAAQRRRAEAGEANARRALYLGQHQPGPPGLEGGQPGPVAAAVGEHSTGTESARGVWLVGMALPLGTGSRRRLAGSRPVRRPSVADCLRRPGRLGHRRFGGRRRGAAGRVLVPAWWGSPIEPACGRHERAGGLRLSAALGQAAEQPARRPRAPRDCGARRHHSQRDRPSADDERGDRVAHLARRPVAGQPRARPGPRCHSDGLEDRGLEPLLDDLGDRRRTDEWRAR
ncbi:MAG: serine/threonine protein kinase [Verrucomicrobiia bacterium]